MNQRQQLEQQLIEKAMKDELTETELEQVAGGYTGDTTCFADSLLTCNKWVCE